MLVEASGRMREICYALNSLGCGNPSHHQVETLGYSAVCTALTQTIWGRRFDPCRAVTHHARQLRRLGGGDRPQYPLAAR